MLLPLGYSLFCGPCHGGQEFSGAVTKADGETVAVTHMEVGVVQAVSSEDGEAVLEVNGKTVDPNDLIRVL